MDPLRNGRPGHGAAGLRIYTASVGVRKDRPIDVQPTVRGTKKSPAMKAGLKDINEALDYLVLPKL